jgi:hypothetical protein
VSEIGAPVQLSATPRHFKADSNTIPPRAGFDSILSEELGVDGDGGRWLADESESQHELDCFAWQQQHTAAGFSLCRSFSAAGSTKSGGDTLFSRAHVNFSHIDMQQQSRQHWSAESQPQRWCMHGYTSPEHGPASSGKGMPRARTE